jgi:aerobic carbon-monoxide dehydrogenase small subunit
MAVTNAVSITVNGAKLRATVEARTSLADYLRDDLDLTATHLACEHGVCGACTVLLDGEPVRSCITLAAAVDGRSVETLEAFDDDDMLNEIRACFSEAHGLQCGFCTSGMLLTTRDIIMRGSATTDEEIRLELSGNLCRCTGYAGIVQAVRLALSRLSARNTSRDSS